MNPRENYTIYLFIAFDLEPWNPLIHNMVSERNGDSDFNPVSDEEDDSDGDEEDLEASASENSSSSTSQEFVFGSFGGSVSTTVTSPWSTPFQPAVNGFTIKIGEDPCFLIDSSCSDQNSGFEASVENQNTPILDSELIVSAKSTNSTNRESEFNVSEAVAKNSKHLIIDTVVSCYGPVYDASVLVGKQDQAVITVKNNFQCFDLHDERIVDFDPGGILCDSMSSLLSRFLAISFFLSKSLSIGYGGCLGIEEGKRLSESYFQQFTFSESCFHQSASTIAFCSLLQQFEAFFTTSHFISALQNLFL